MRLVHPRKPRVVDERVVEGQVRVVRAADRPAPALVARRIAPAPEPRAHNERDAVRDDGVEDEDGKKNGKTPCFWKRRRSSNAAAVVAVVVGASSRNSFG